MSIWPYCCGRLCAQPCGRLPPPGRDRRCREMRVIVVDHVERVIAGGARGADRLGYRWSWKHQVPHKLFRAEWDRWGKSAGMRRNAQMAQAGDVLVAFWSLTSRGTAHMIGEMQRLGKPVVVFGLDGREVEVAP